jgi:hypothetical protein
MKSNLLLGIVIFTQLISVALGSAAQSGPPGDGSFFGTVRDSANVPLPATKVFAVNNATNVRLEARMLQTGLFGLPFLPSGIYRIHAELPGFQTIIRVEPIERGPSNVNFWLPVVPVRDATANHGVITGTVRGFDNVSLARVAITFRNATTGKSHQVMSDTRGTFSASDLDAGVFEVVAEREGFQTLRMGDLHLSAGSTTQLQLKLRAVAPGRAGLPTAAR